jgi:hypothetical protein
MRKATFTLSEKFWRLHVCNFKDFKNVLNILIAEEISYKSCVTGLYDVALKDISKVIIINKYDLRN